MKFWVGLFFFSTVILFISLFYHSIIEFDQDLGRHLLMGQIISQTHQVPKINLLSYTWPNFPFINSHWLSEVIFYQILNSFKTLTALLYLKVFILTAALTLTIFTALRYSKNILSTAIAFTFLVPVLLERTEIRPEIFSYFFCAIFIYVLLLKRKLLWLLPLLEIVWVNSHIYFILGPILVFIFFLYQLFSQFQNYHSLFPFLRPTTDYFYLFLAACFATFLNPNGLSGALYPLTVFNNYGYTIVENQNIFFLSTVLFNPNIFYFEIGLSLLILSFLLTEWKKISLINLGLASLAILPLLAIRSFPYLFLLELPILSYNLANLNPKIIAGVKNRVKLNYSQVTRGLLALVIIITFIRTVRLTTNDYYLSIDSHKRFGNQIQESGKGAADFVLRNNLRGPIFNNFDMGSYLDYRFYLTPILLSLTPFIDGRPEAYPATFFQNLYIPAQMTEENFKKVDDVYKFRVIIFAHTDATPWAQNFLSGMVKNSNYSLVYLDSYAVVFIKNTAYPQLANNKILLDTVPVTNKYLDDLNLGQFMATAGRIDLAQKFFEKAYALNPDSVTANKILLQIYANNQSTAFLANKIQQKLAAKGPILF